MQLGRVIGTVVPAVIVPGLSGTPLLWVQPLDRARQPTGEAMVCADGTRMAGPGEEVYWVESREAALTLDPSFVPVDHAIVGLVDDVRLDPPADERRPARKAPTKKAGQTTGKKRSGR